jgi:uncharacterized protein YaiI (UPF0178 family)
MDPMKILVDGDSCPVKKTIVTIAEEKKIPVIFIVSTAGYFDRGWDVRKIMVDSLPQAVDIAIVNRVEAGDVVVTQDYGLAALVLGKKGKAISPRGYLFNDDNIESMLYRRHLHQEARKAGVRMKGPKKRSEKDEKRFSKNFSRLLDECLKQSQPS